MSPSSDPCRAACRPRLPARLRTRRRSAFTRAMSSRMLKGLVTYSSAPISRPSTRSSSSDFAVSMRIGVQGFFSRMRLQTERPSIFGSIRSRMTSECPPPSAFWSPARPSLARSVRNPRSRRFMATTSPISRSSSMIRIVPPWPDRRVSSVPSLLAPAADSFIPRPPSTNVRVNVGGKQMGKDPTAQPLLDAPTGGATYSRP